MRRTHVLAALTAVAVLGFTLPAVGATKSPLSALGLAKKANKTANSAKKTAVSAKKNALIAKSSASSAGKKAQSALDALKKPVPSAVAAGSAVNATNATNATKAATADNATHANAAGSADNVIVLPLKKVAVSGTAATVAAARTAATEVPLFTSGTLSVYGKCFKDSGANRVYGETYIRTTADRAVFNSSNSGFSGGAATDYLNADTVEVNRQLLAQSVNNNSAYTSYPHDSQFQAIAANGTSFIEGTTEVSVKQGTLAGGDGPYGPGDVCMFRGTMMVG